jgi:hypothetical protein
VVVASAFVTWSETATYSIDSTGNIVDGDCYVSSMFELEPGYSYALKPPTGGNYIRYATYTEDGAFVEYGFADSQFDSLCTDLFSDGNAKKARIGVHPTSTSIDLDSFGFEQLGIWSRPKYKINFTTGEITTAQSNCVTLQKIPVEAGGTYTLRNINDGDFNYLGAVEYDSSGAFIKASETQAGDFTVTLSENTAFVMWKANGASGTEPNGNLEYFKVE